MGTVVRPNQLVRFKTFELNLKTRELSRNGVRLRLTGHPIDVLAMLLEQPGELVSRESLQKALWPEDTFVDFEHGLNNAINRLREALGDHAEEPRYIETLPRLGYRFIAPVEESLREALIASLPNHGSPVVSSPTGSTILPSTEVQPERVAPSPPRSQLRHSKWVVSGLAVLVIALALATWYLRLPLPPPQVNDPIQLTYSGMEKDPIDTDGNNLFLNLWDRRAVAQMPVSGGPITQIPIHLPGMGDFDNEPPDHASRLMDISPDGSHLLVLDHGDAQMSETWVVGVSGQSAHYLTKARSAAWSSDGKSVVYGTVHGDLNLIPAEGGESVTLISAAASAGKGRPIEDLSISPDGRRIRFTQGNVLWEVTANGANPHRFLQDRRIPSWQCCGRWTANGDFFIFLSGDTRLRGPRFLPGAQLWAIDERKGHLRPPGKEPMQLTRGPILWGTPTPTRDGQKILSRGVTLRSELVRYDRESHQLQPYLGGRSAEFVDFSSDGNFVAFVSFPDGVLWKANRDGTEPVQLTKPPFYPKLIHWSPNGTQILFTDYSSMGTETMYIVSSMGGTPMRVLPEDNGPQQGANWSPDGRKVVFTSKGESESEQADNEDIRILDLDSHDVTSIPDSIGLSSPEWSPDGRYIAVLTTSGSDLKIYDLQLKEWKALNVGGYAQSPVWSRDSHSIYAVLYQDHGVFQFPLNGQKAERILDLKDFRHTGWYGLWLGLDPNDAPLLLRDLGSDEIYQFTLK